MQPLPAVSPIRLRRSHSVDPSGVPSDRWNGSAPPVAFAGVSSTPGTSSLSDEDDDAADDDDEEEEEEDDSADEEAMRQFLKWRRQRKQKKKEKGKNARRKGGLDVSGARGGEGEEAPLWREASSTLAQHEEAGRRMSVGEEEHRRRSFTETTGTVLSRFRDSVREIDPTIWSPPPQSLSYPSEERRAPPMGQQKPASQQHQEQRGDLLHSRPHVVDPSGSV